MDSATKKVIVGLRTAVDERLLHAINVSRGPKSIAKKAVRYSTLSNGHRWRPLLFLALMRSIGKSNRQYLGAAAGIEVLHSATLIIDDLPFIDNAPLRRGQPSCHIRFGTDIAVYASHLAMDLAEECLVNEAPSSLQINVFQSIKRLKERLVMGQCIERALSMNRKTFPKKLIDEQYYLKSGSLFGFIGRLAGILSTLNARECGLLESFGEGIGVAYQIADDLTDCEDDVSSVGKPTNMDIFKVNYPRYWGIDFALKKLVERQQCNLNILQKLKSEGLIRQEALLIAVMKQIVNPESYYERKNNSSP